MEASKIQSISIIGAGNVATHLASGLLDMGIQVHEVWSKHPENAALLAQKLNAKVCTNLSNIQAGVDLIVISVKDDALMEVVKQLPVGLPAVVHTSGSLDMQLLKGCAANIGVFYPLQSFNREDKVVWKNIPVCVEANSDKFTNLLFELGKALTGHVTYINSTQRIQLHIAAIFSNNFSNYLFALAHELTTKQHLPFSLLIPLIEQTTSRLGNTDPFLLQTGPAKRKDTELIKKHLELLSAHPDAKDVYAFISNKIIEKSSR